MKKVNLNKMETIQGGDCLTAVAIGAGIWYWCRSW